MDLVITDDLVYIFFLQIINIDIWSVNKKSIFKYTKLVLIDKQGLVLARLEFIWLH